jgi:hypothetical protein
MTVPAIEVNGKSTSGRYDRWLVGSTICKKFVFKAKQTQRRAIITAWRTDVIARASLAYDFG